MRIECGFGMDDFSIGVCARTHQHERTGPHAHAHTHTQVDAQGVSTVDCRPI